MAYSPHGGSKRQAKPDGACEKCGKYCGEHIFDDCCCSCWRGCFGCVTNRDGCAARGHGCRRGCYFCCNKCCHNDNPTVEEHYEMCKVNDHKRKCTDFGCCILFFAWWVVWLVFAGIALDKGDPIQLIYGQDYQGAQCGIDDYESGLAYPNHADQKKVVYPRLGEDIQDWANSYDFSDVSDIDWLNVGWDLLQDLNLTGVCVSDCPRMGDVICTDHYRGAGYAEPSATDAVKCYSDVTFAATNRYMCDNCWAIALNTTDIFNRCLEIIKTETTETESCIFPTNGGNPTNDCLTVNEIITSSADKPHYSNPFNEYLSAGFQFVAQALADVENSQEVMWTCGVAFPFVLAFAYILFLYMCAWPLVWGTILSYILVHGWISLWLWLQSGYIRNDWLENSVAFGDASGAATTIQRNGTVSSESNQVDGNSDSTDDFYLASAILCSIAYAIGMCVIASVFTQIRIAVKIIQETSKALMKIPSLMLYPMFQVGAICLLILYFFTVGIYMATMDDVTVLDVASDAGFACASNCSTSLNFTEIVAGCAGSTPSCPESSGAGCSGDGDAIQSCLAQYMRTCVAQGHFSCTDAEIDAQIYGAWDCGVGFVDSDTALNYFLFWFHLLSFLWTLNFVDAIGICVIAGAVCQWYWILPSKGGKKRMPSRFPVLSSITRVYRFHLGSMAYGSAIVAIVGAVRAIMAYVDRKTKDVQAKNCIVRYLMKVVHCLLWCFEKCVKFITKNAYIYVAMRGYSFCKAARNAFYALVHNMRQFAVTHVITAIFLLLGKVVITLSCGFMAYLWVEYNDDFAAGNERELYLPVLPVIIASTIAFFATTNFLNVYDLAISSVLLCFCEDYKMHIATGREHMAFMSNSLRAAVTRTKVHTEKEMKEAVKRGDNVSALAESKMNPL